MSGPIKDGGPAFQVGDSQTAHRVGMAATNGTGRPESDYIAASARATAGMTLRDYFAAKAPAEIPAWFQYEPKMPCPEVPSTSKLTAEQRSEYNNLDFIEEEEMSPEVRDFAKRHADACEAFARWNAEQSVGRYIAWRWHYADMMLAAREVTP